MLDLRGPIPRMIPSIGLEAIQELGGHSFVWHNEEGVRRSDEPGMGELNAIFEQIKEFEQYMKFVIEEVQMAQHKFDTPIEGRTEISPKKDGKEEVEVEKAGKESEMKRKVVESYVPPIPFLGRLKNEKERAQFIKFLENLQQLIINIPFVEALEQMPKYAKFIKNILTNKAKLEETLKVTLNERCSVVLFNKIPLKERDPRSFTIHCFIEKLVIDKFLTDLGARISLMPYLMLVRLDQLDSFLLKPTKGYQPRNNEIEIINLWDEEKEEIDETQEELRCSWDDRTTPELGSDLECLHPNIDNNPTLFAASTTNEEKHIPKLKELPSHLECTFLDGKPEFLVIISSLLSKQEKILLLQVLTKHKTAFAWKVANIRD
ncbi:hypothetical protein Tco_0512102 [Tanacetum coccineum]